MLKAKRDKAAIERMRQIPEIKDPADLLKKLQKKGLKVETEFQTEYDLHHFETNYREYQAKSQRRALAFWIIAAFLMGSAIALIKNLLQ
jgi:hypothetical protein